MGSSAGKSTTTVKNLPEYAQPFVQDYLLRSSILSKTGLSNYEESTYANQTLEEQDGINKLAIRGRNGNLGINKSVDYIDGVLIDSYLNNTSPEFQIMLDLISDKSTQSFLTYVKPKIGATNELMGNLGNENHAQDLTINTPAKYINRLNKYLYDKTYNNDRNRQGNILDYSNVFISRDIKDAEILRIAGLYTRDYQQGNYINLYTRWFENETLKARSIDILGNAIRTMTGTQSSKTEPYYRIPKWVPVTISAVGGAIAGAQIGSAIYPGIGTVVGAIIGAIVGAIIGYIGS